MLPYIHHIEIPYDELLLFKAEQKYQSYLIETLIYSNRVSYHKGKQVHSCLLAITKHNIWLEFDNNSLKKKNLSLTALEAVIRCEKHPQLVVLTDKTSDNMRLSMSNEERCNNFLSSLAYYCRYLSNESHGLQVYCIQQNNLMFFERTVKQKQEAQQPNLSRYPSFNTSPVIYGHLIIGKMLLVKQLYQKDDHMIHLAKVNGQDYCICHTMNSNQELSAALKDHVNLERVQKLICARSRERKLQLFFEFIPSVKRDLCSIKHFFEQAMSLYDIIKAHRQEAVLTLDILCQLRTSICLRQFRYNQLLIDHQIAQFVNTPFVKQQLDRAEAFQQKMYNIGLVLYNFVFGRVLFQHQSPQLLIDLKQNMKTVPFPKYFNAKASVKLRNFLYWCILCRFDTPAQLYEHPWIKEQKISQ